MALVKCKECGHSVSTKAESCPSCGAKLKSSSGPVSGCIVGLGKLVGGVIGAIVGLGFAIALLSNGNKVDPAQELEKRCSAMADSYPVASERSDFYGNCIAGGTVSLKANGVDMGPNAPTLDVQSKEQSDTMEHSQKGFPESSPEGVSEHSVSVTTDEPATQTEPISASPEVNQDSQSGN